MWPKGNSKCTPLNRHHITFKNNIFFSSEHHQSSYFNPIPSHITVPLQYFFFPSEHQPNSHSSLVIRSIASFSSPLAVRPIIEWGLSPLAFFPSPNPPIRVKRRIMVLFKKRVKVIFVKKINEKFVIILKLALTKKKNGAHLEFPVTETCLVCSYWIWFPCPCLWIFCFNYLLPFKWSVFKIKLSPQHISNALKPRCCHDIFCL